MNDVARDGGVENTYRFNLTDLKFDYLKVSVRSISGVSKTIRASIAESKWDSHVENGNTRIMD
jgi:hypothetical protein